MKKSRLLGAVCTCLLTASMSTMANAGTVGISGKYSSGPNFGDPGWSSALGSGQAQIYDTEGTEVGRPIPTSGWNFDFDTGTAELIFGDDIFSDVYFHNITFTDNNDGTYSGSMLWDWGPHINQPFDILWEITNNGNNTISIVTIDGNGDGIPGIPIPPDSSAFPGFSWALDNASLTAVPILPSVDIEKLTNGIQADEANDPDVPNIAQGMTVTWTYEITNTGDIALGEAEIIVTDNQPGVLPVFNTGSDTGGDMILSPGEIWTYTASAQALDLKVPPAGVTIVQGCNNNRNTYQNIGRAEITSTGYFDEDFSHYCNPFIDGDNDGIPVEQDNCLLVANADQRDTDGDGYGNICDADLNQDSVVNLSDFSSFRGAFGATTSLTPTEEHADFNGDGQVNLSDFSIFRSYFGKPPEPSCIDLPGGCVP